MNLEAQSTVQNIDDYPEAWPVLDNDVRHRNERNEIVDNLPNIAYALSYVMEI